MTTMQDHQPQQTSAIPPIVQPSRRPWVLAPNQGVSMVSMDLHIDAMRNAARRFGLHTEFQNDPHYWIHLVFTNLWLDKAPKPWRIVTNVNRRLDQEWRTVLGYLPTSIAHDLQERAQINGTPDVLAGVRSICTKAMPSKWAAGFELKFDIIAAPRMCPNRKKWPQFNHWLDIFEFKKAIGSATDGQEEEVYLRWLELNFNDCGVTLQRMDSLAWEDRKAIRRSHERDGQRKGYTQPLRSVQFKGSLIVRDGDKFNQTLLHGIGKELPFGFGMMLVKA